MRKELYHEIKRKEKELPGELQRKLQTETELINKLDRNDPDIKKHNCYVCKYMIFNNGVMYCSYKKKNIKVTYKSCRYYHRKHTTPKTKTIAIEKWNKYLNNAYYKENKGALSKSQLRKVEKWRATHKTYN